MVFDSITSTQAAWTIVFLLAFTLPWLIVRAIPGPKDPPRQPPAIESPPPIQDSDDRPDWLKEGARPPADWRLPAFPRFPFLSHYERRRLRMRTNGGWHTRAEWLALCEQYNYRCLCCRRKRSLTKDHIIPIAEGGSDDIENIQPLCQSCNSRKHTQTIDYRSRRKAR